jgi:SAM-dependent methyltransferase
MSASTEHNSNETENSRLRIGSRDKNVGWFNSNLESLTPAQRDLFETYSHIPPDRVIPHILEVVRTSPIHGCNLIDLYSQREKAWEFHPLPCIGQIRFIDFTLSQSSLYPDILSRLKSGESLLDLGCCLAQDLRKLAHDGAPASSLYGAELESQYLELGYELFLDRETFQANFIVADIFDEQGPLEELDGKMDIVYIGLFLHLFDLEEQQRICERIVRLLKNKKGVLVLGTQVGSTKPKDVPFGATKNVFRHDEITFEKLWKVVGEKTNTEWKVTTTMDGGLGAGSRKRPWDDEDTRRLVFEVERTK